MTLTNHSVVASQAQRSIARLDGRRGRPDWGCTCWQSGLRTILLLYQGLLLAALGGFGGGADPRWLRAEESAQRYFARMTDGTVLAGDELTDWHQTNSVPKLQGKPLLDTEQPLRFLVDRSLPTYEEKGSWIEFATGDRLPGRVVGYRAGSDSPFVSVPPHFLVDLPAEFGSIIEPRNQPLRVATSWVRRVVWRRSVTAGKFTPQAIFLSEGGEYRYRAIRYGRDGVTALLEEGPRAFRFEQVAELHLSEQPAWEVVLRELGELTAVGEKRLLQLETYEGLVATTSLERFRARTRTSPTLADQWEHAVQPVWSLDPFWVRSGHVRTRRLFPIEEVSLTRLWPKEQQQSLLGSDFWPYRVNQNVRGGPLRTGQGEAGWGLGVQAVSTLRFELSPLVTGFQTAVGLDYVAGQGGCIQAHAYLLTGGQRVSGVEFHSPVLVGSDAVADSGRIMLTQDGSGKPREWVLEVDAAHQQRPPGADPYDVRDTADWVQPTLFLERAPLLDELARRYRERVPVWDGWRVEGDATLRTQNWFAESAPPDDRFLTALVQRAEPLRLTRSQPIGPLDHWLVIHAAHLLNAGSAPKLTVRIAGRVLLEQPLPPWQRNVFDRRPLVVPLAEFQTDSGEPVEIQIEVAAAADAAPVCWQGLAISAQHPSLYRLFDELGSRLSNAAELRPYSDTEHHFSGERSLKLNREQTVELLVPQPVAVRESPQPGEYRLLKCVVRGPHPEANLHIELLDDNPLAPPAHYSLGPRDPGDPQTRRIVTKALGEGWLEITRDLFGDFGRRNLTGLKITCNGGDTIWLDHVYLARVQNDFKQ